MNISKFLMLTWVALLLNSYSALAALNADPEQQRVHNQHGKLVWADLYSGDVEASISFYSNTFGWTTKAFAENSPRYHIFYDEGRPIAGLLERESKRSQTDQALWVGSIDTDSVADRVDLASKDDATIILPPHDFKFYGKRAVIADPQGAIIALLELDLSNDKYQGISTQWDWAQLFSVDTQTAAAFYQDILGYGIESINVQNNSFYLVQGDMVQASVIKMPESFEQRDRWVNFVRVNDVKTLAANATKNGATIIYQPENQGIAIIRDPNGALIGVVQKEAK
jgi:predicted enzyme related to lactoylglutathione lyase